MANVKRLRVTTLDVPTEKPESDGTLAWNRTTMVLVEADGGGATGIGWTYADAATARVVHDELARVVEGTNAMATSAAHSAMTRRVRNLGRDGICAMAISAVDTALWDLKARLLGVSLVDLLGPTRERVRVYGSGGFTSETMAELATQLGGWAAHGIDRVKMKVGRHPSLDPERVHVAREAIGPRAELFVDANGAYARKQALAIAEAFAKDRVSWFEEPVSSDDLEGLRLLRDRAPAGMEISAGEYGYTLDYFERMLGAVDVIQADVTRCGGYTGFLRVAALAEARHVPMSSHCAPQLHAHLGAAIAGVRHLEWFFDHARIERTIFDGALVPADGALRPDTTLPGNGLAIRRKDAAKFALA